MSATRNEARDEMYGRITKVNDSNPARRPVVPALYYQGLMEPYKPSNILWLRATIHTADTEQTTLSTNVGKPGQRRYTVSGLLVVQIFMPKGDDEIIESGEAIAQAIQAEFRNWQSECAIVYRNSRINELPQEDMFYRLNVVTEFQYDETNKE